METEVPSQLEHASLPLFDAPVFPNMESSLSMAASFSMNPGTMHKNEKRMVQLCQHARPSNTRQHDPHPNDYSHCSTANFPSCTLAADAL